MNFDINKLRNAFITLEKNKSKSKEKNDNKKLEHLYSANTMKIEESNQNTENIKKDENACKWVENRRKMCVKLRKENKG